MLFKNLNWLSCCYSQIKLPAIVISAEEYLMSLRTSTMTAIDMASLLWRLKTTRSPSFTASASIQFWFTSRLTCRTSTKVRSRKKKKFCSGWFSRKPRIELSWSLASCSRPWLKRLNTWLYISVSQFSSLHIIGLSRICMHLQISDYHFQLFKIFTNSIFSGVVDCCVAYLHNHLSVLPGTILVDLIPFTNFLICRSVPTSNPHLDVLCRRPREEIPL